MNWFSKIQELAGQEYERYLPTAFDGSLTLLEKVNKVIETLNQIVLGVNTIADYVDGHVDTQNETIKQLRDDFEILKDWLENEGLEERTEQVLNEWFDNGRLAQIINNDVFNMKADKEMFEAFVLSTTTQLAHKAQRDEVRKKQDLITLNDVDTEFINALTETGVNVTLESTPKDKSVTEKKTTFLKSINSMNELTLINNTLYNSAGVTSPFDGMLSTEQFSMNAQQKIWVKNLRVAVYYDNDHVFQATLFNEQGAKLDRIIELTMPINGYMAFSVKKMATPPFASFSKNELDYKGDYQVDPAIVVDGKQVKDVPLENTDGFERVNHYNPVKRTKGHLVGDDGVLVAFATIDTSDYIYVPAGTDVNITPNRKLGVYDKQFQFIELIDNAGYIPTYGYAMAVDGYIRVSFRNTDSENMVTFGTIPSTYVPYERYKMNSNIITNTNTQTSGTVRFEHKPILFLGHSIIRNYSKPLSIPAVFEERLGLPTINGAFGGARMSYDTVAGHTPMSMARLIDAMISNDYTEQTTRATTEQTGITSTRSLESISNLKKATLSEVEYVFLMFGVNDYLQSVSIGDIDSEDKNTYLGAWNYVVRRLQTAYPKMKLFIVSAPYEWRPDDETFDVHTTTNAVGLLLTDYVEADQQIANKYGIPFFNTLIEGGINDFNRTTYFSGNDGIHPNTTGILELGQRAVSHFESMY